MAASLVLVAGDFDPKVGWLAGALVAGLLAGWMAGKLSNGRLPGEIKGGLPGALLMGAAVVWGPMWLIPAVTSTPRAEAVPRAGAKAPAEASARPNFLLIVIDALRADHLGAYGYARPTSEAIDDLAKHARRFDDVVAPSSWTLPSMSSILTSLYPGQHGAAERGAKLPADLARISGRLHDAGYRTAALTTNPWLKRVFSFDDGFDEYLDLDRLTLDRRLLGVRLKNLALRRLNLIRLDPELVPRASEITARSLAWLENAPPGPFFLYLHYMDVHAPYDPIPEFRGRFCSGHRFDEPDRFLESRFRSGKYRRDPAVLEHVIELYDEDLLAADQSIGRLLQGLSALGLKESTTVILTADHGEEFYEHGETTHGHNLYRETIRVPLIIAPAGKGGAAPAVVAARVSTLDILPTILEIAGVEPPPKIEGRSLVPLLRGAVTDAGAGSGEPGNARPIGSQLVENGRAWAALYLGEEKIVRIRPPANDPTAKSVTRLFHLKAAPSEIDDVSLSEPELAARLSGALDALEKVWGIAGTGGKRSGETVDPETLRQLKALGYIN